ncbi:MAG: DUF4136 domain-containing protein, partial [Blastocatellia bacterium]
AWGKCETPEEMELWQGRIVQAVEVQLAARGFRRAPPGWQPDVIVNCHSDVEERVSYVGYNYGYGTGWGWGPGWGTGWGPGGGLGWGPGWGPGWGGGPLTVDPVVRQEFDLAVELVDACQNRLLWRGVASDYISRKSEKNIKRLRRAVEKMFRDYPYQR